MPPGGEQGLEDAATFLSRTAKAISLPARCASRAGAHGDRISGQRGVLLVEKVYQFIGLSVKAVRQGSKPQVPRLYRQSVFEE